MKKIEHPKYGDCYEMTDRNDIAFSKIAQGALLNNTVLPSGAKTPSKNLWFRGKYLVSREHAPKGSPEV